MTIRDVVTEGYRNLVQPIIKEIKEFAYIREIIISGLLLLIILGSFFGYRLYNLHLEKEAQKILTECIEEYEKATQDPAIWPRVVMACELGYKHHKQSRLAPYFLSFQTDALLKQNKKEEALSVMDSLFAIMKEDSPLFTLYKTKQALVYLDMDDPERQETGLKELRHLAQDKTNITNDVALYYLGLHHWSKNEVEEAKKIWQELVAQQVIKEEREVKPMPSPWVELAQEKLQQIA